MFTNGDEIAAPLLKLLTFLKSMPCDFLLSTVDNRDFYVSLHDVNRFLFVLINRII